MYGSQETSYLDLAIKISVLHLFLGISEGETEISVLSCRNGRKKPGIKALHTFRNDSDQLKTIDLAERAILEGDATSHRVSTDGPAIVRERFDRSSVTQAIEGAFSGDSKASGLSEAAKISNKSQQNMAS